MIRKPGDESCRAVKGSIESESDDSPILTPNKDSDKDYQIPEFCHVSRFLELEDTGTVKQTWRSMAKVKVCSECSQALPQSKATANTQTPGVNLRESDSDLKDNFNPWPQLNLKVQKKVISQDILPPGSLKLLLTFTL